MHILVAAILGLVEGITEFLPISSTGHLIVFEKLLKFHDVHDLFTVVVQSGAILAVIWFYWRDLSSKVVGLFKWDSLAVHFWKLLIIATIPAGVVGLALNSVQDRFTTPAVVAVALIVGGVILWLVDRKPAPRHAEEPADIATISFKKALIVGLGQCVAIIPGVSRSGATIVTGLGTGLNRPTATAFSFYLSIPVLVLASGLKLIKDGNQIHQLSGGAAALIVALIVAFGTAFMSIKWLLHYVSHHNFTSFAYYRIVAGVIILLLLAAGAIK
jgi:undecaprenyl-diphosphatase